MMFFIGFVVLIVGGIVSLWYREYFKYSPYLVKYRGPRPIPVFGNAYKISSTKDVVPVIMAYLKEYGPVIKLWFGFKPRIIISDYKLAAKLLKSSSILDKSDTYNFFYPWLGRGLLTSTGEQWKKQRKLLTPAFHFRILQQFFTIFNKQSDVLLAQLDKTANSGPIDVYDTVSLFGLDVISESAMGIQINAQEGNSRAYVDSIRSITNILIRRLISPLKNVEFLFKLTEDFKKQEAELEVIHKFTSSVISSREKKLVENANKSKNTCVSKKHFALLDLLLRNRMKGENLSLKYIRDEVNTFMLEGHDSATTAIAYILYCMSKNMEVQERVYKEICNVVENNPTIENIQNMKYLDMVIKESMRLYPPVPLIAREIPKNTEFDGVFHPNGITLSLFVYGLHRQEEVYPDPEKFDPERFSNENSARRSPFSYVPFSAGPRNCIGQRYAMLEMKVVLLKILRRFKVLPVPEYGPIMATDFVLRPTNGVWVSLKTREC